jgi:outer membrane protein assembly factor BamA
LLLCVGEVFSQNQKNTWIKYVIETSNNSEEKNIVPKKEVLSRKIGLEKQVNNVLIQLFERGYMSANIDSISENKNDTINVFIYTGKKYQWLNLENENIDEGVINKIGYRDKFYINKAFRYKDVAALMKRLVQYYENNGYPFATAGLNDIELLDDNKISAKIWINKHKEYKLDSLIIKGETKVSKKYISSYLGLEEGGNYNESEISKIKKRVEDLPFLDLTSSPEIEFNKEEAKVYLHLKDRKASQFDGILGILPNDNTPGQILLTGDLKLKLLSAFGRGELIDLNWKKLQSETQDLKVNFAYPYLFGSSIGVDLKFNLYKRDSTFLNLNQTVALQYLLSGGDYFELFINNKLSSLLGGNSVTGGVVPPNNINVENLASTRALLYGIGIFRQRLDYRFNPRKGFFIDADGAVGTRKITLKKTDELEVEDNDKKGNNVQYEVNFKGGYFIPVFKRATFLFQNFSGITSAETIYENELSRIGGLKSLRGFDEESVFASLFSIFTIEARYLLEKNSFAHVFFDGAYYENKSVGKNIVDRPFGFGAGFSFETKAGIFSISYALGKQFDNPIEFRTGKIHFGIVGFF